MVKRLFAESVQNVIKRYNLSIYILMCRPTLGAISEVAPKVQSRK